VRARRRRAVERPNEMLERTGGGEGCPVQALVAAVRAPGPLGAPETACANVPKKRDLPRHERR
jgi:hypothetical protein